MAWKHLSSLIMTGLVVLMTIPLGCRRGQQAGPGEVFSMGSQVRVGSLTYQVIDADWRDSLDTATGPRQPKNRYLMLNVTVTNNGNEDAGVPLMALIDSKGTENLEERKGDGVPQWLGYLRVLAPGTSQSGYVLFDAPAESYKMRVSSGGEPDKEQTALIEIPFKIDQPAVKEETSLPPAAEVK